MSEKNKPNGACHDEAEVQDNPATVRSRRFRERQAGGILVLRDIEIAPDMVQALIACGWLHASEMRNREAVTAAIGAIVLRSLAAGVTPSAKPLLTQPPSGTHGYGLGPDRNPRRRTRRRPYRRSPDVPRLQALAQNYSRSV